MPVTGDRYFLQWSVVRDTWVEMTPPWPLVGRARALERVGEMLLGRPDLSGVVLVGPAGVGKTRLAKECLTLAEDAGFVTAVAVASRAAAEIPLGALAPLIP